MKHFCFAFLAVVVLLTCSVVSFAASSERLDLESKEMKSDNPVMKGIEAKKGTKPRLPNGYGKLVSAQQKEDIYAIQREYLPLIELLRVRMELLKAEMDNKIKDKLSPEQAKKVDKAKSTKEKEVEVEKGTEKEEE
ncbi:MAG: hypothetical protein ACRC10_10880 [Thermoguttaceae bacterium]